MTTISKKLASLNDIKEITAYFNSFEKLTDDIKELLKQHRKAIEEGVP